MLDAQSVKLYAILYTYLYLFLCVKIKIKLLLIFLFEIAKKILLCGLLSSRWNRFIL